MVKKWVVVGGAGNGIMVRNGRDMSSNQEPERLATGAVVEEQEISANRMKYKKVSGSGPKAGWVSVSAGGKDLLVEVSASEGGQAADALTKVVAGAFEADEAMAIYKSLSNKNDKAAGALLCTIPDLFLKDQNPAAAVAVAEEAVDLFKSKGDKVGLASSYVALANAQFAQELKGAAVASVGQARAIFKELGDSEGEASVLQTMIRIMLVNSQSAEAVTAATEMIALVRRKKDGKTLGASLILQSEVLLECGRPAEASAAACEAQDIFAKSGEKREEADAHLAVAYAEMNREYGKAVASAQAAADLFSNLGDIEAQAGALYTTANAHLSALAIKQRTCLIPSKADTEGVINAAKESHQLYAQVHNREGQALAMQVLQTVLTVNGAESNAINDRTSTESMMANMGQVKYGVTKNVAAHKVLYNQQKFAWRDSVQGYHYTLIWEHQIDGMGQNKRAGYKTVMAGKAARSAALPMYHSLKNSFNSCSNDEGPLMIHMNGINSSWEYATSLMSSVSTVTAMLTCKVSKLVFIQVNECPPGSSEDRGKCRQVYMSPVTLSILRTARLENPSVTMGYIALDTASWNNNRAEVIAALPDVVQSEESEVHFYKGTPIAPTLIQQKMEPGVEMKTTRNAREQHPMTGMRV